MFDNPTVADFKNYFFRDFPYADDEADLTKVTVRDITSALADAGVNFNSALFEDQATYSLCFLLLSAHYLVTNLKASSQGIAGQYAWLTTSKGVGSVSEGVSIPERILANPFFAMLSKTRYGAKYLEMMLPRIVGQAFTVQGHTKP